MAKKKTPEELNLERERKSLLPYHMPELITKDDHIEPEPWSEGELPPTPGAWPRTHPLLAGLENATPEERFSKINEALFLIDQLTIENQNLRETSRVDVRSYYKKALDPKRNTGGRGYKADGTSNQATDDEIDDALKACSGLSMRKAIKTIVYDAGVILKTKQKKAGDTKLRERLRILREKKI
jgi:hypothetical protein